MTKIKQGLQKTQESGAKGEKEGVEGCKSRIARKKEKAAVLKDAHIAIDNVQKAINKTLPKEDPGTTNPSGKPNALIVIRHAKDVQNSKRKKGKRTKTLPNGKEKYISRKVSLKMEEKNKQRALQKCFHPL